MQGWFVLFVCCYCFINGIFGLLLCSFWNLISILFLVMIVLLVRLIFRFWNGCCCRWCEILRCFVCVLVRWMVCCISGWIWMLSLRCVMLICVLIVILRLLCDFGCVMFFVMFICWMVVVWWIWFCCIVIRCFMFMCVFIILLVMFGVCSYFLVGCVLVIWVSQVSYRCRC